METILLVNSTLDNLFPDRGSSWISTSVNLLWVFQVVKYNQSVQLVMWSANPTQEYCIAVLVLVAPHLEQFITFGQILPILGQFHAQQKCVKFYTARSGVWPQWFSLLIVVHSCLDLFTSSLVLSCSSVSVIILLPFILMKIMMIIIIIIIVIKTTLVLIESRQGRSSLLRGQKPVASARWGDKLSGKGGCLLSGHHHHHHHDDFKDCKEWEL